ncbi:MAG: hydantoinase B/oxoprolinase family protein, partial [Actinobacteria bacterium]|nr:hydantoinase B/oxoprolinase family protein [Actinomycetota bacterium]
MAEFLHKEKGRFEEDYKPIGWDGMTLRDMLETSERLIAETGSYWGVDELELKEKDPIRYEKIFAKLRGGLVNARETAMNISASPIVQEIGELCFALYTPEGDSVALSTGIIVHVHTMSDAIKFMVRNDYELNPRINPGDLFSNNIPKIGDVHNADVQTFVPIFWEGELVGWAGGVTHVTDIGASTPGNVPVGPISSYEDGLALTANKIGENDIVYRDHQIRCEQGVRTPMFWKLDERCRIAGCHMIRDAVERTIRDEGIDTYKQFVREAIEEGRRTFIERIKELLIPGRYFAPSFMDMPMEGEKGLPDYAAIDSVAHAPLELVVGPGGEFHISFDGTNKWGYHSFNCPPSAMQGAIWVLMTQTLIPNDKVNDGAYLATSHEFPPYTLANPVDKEASTGAAWGYLIPAFTGLIRSISRGCFARGYVEEVLASYAMTMNALQGGGKDQYGNDTGILSFELSCVGGGARGVTDGLDYAAAMWNPEGDMGDMELWELIIPFLYLGRGVKPNTAGMGKYRGGSGFQSLYAVWKTTDLVMQNAGDGNTFPSPGIFGGYPSASGYRHNVLKTDLLERFRKKQPYPTREDDPADSEISRYCEGEHLFDTRTLNYPYRMYHGDIYYSYYRGGGGLGDPIEREPELIEKDLNENFVLPRYAEKVYGAVTEQDDRGFWRVDARATAKRRDEIREERGRRAVPVREFLAGEREKV